MAKGKRNTGIKSHPLPDAAAFISYDGQVKIDCRSELTAVLHAPADDLESLNGKLVAVQAYVSAGACGYEVSPNAWRLVGRLAAQIEQGLARLAGQTIPAAA